MDIMTVISPEVTNQLASLCGDMIAFNVSMAKRTTLRIGGKADAVFEPTSINIIAPVLTACAQHNIPLVPIGAGTNVLVSDKGIRGVVMSSRKLLDITYPNETTIVAQAGVNTGKLLKEAKDRNLGGVEFLAGVPGTLGGGLRMNAGTYLGEFKEVTQSVTSIDLVDGTTKTRDNNACGFAYRTSSLPKNEFIVSASFSLYVKDKQLIEEEIQSLRNHRKEKEPKQVFNAGSIFKNPPGDYAGRLIETAGMKGHCIGDALCSPIHANWIVNQGKATSLELMTLIKEIQQRVFDVHHIKLDLEVKLIGDEYLDQ